MSDALTRLLATALARTLVSKRQGQRHQARCNYSYWIHRTGGDPCGGSCQSARDALRLAAVALGEPPGRYLDVPPVVAKRKPKPVSS